MGLGLGEGGIVAAGAADQCPAGAATAGGKEVAVAFAVEEGRPGQPADEAVRPIASVYVIGAWAGLDQVVLGAGMDRVVAEAAGETDAADGQQRADHPPAVRAGAEVDHQPASRSAGRAGDSRGAVGGVLTAGADR